MTEAERIQQLESFLLKNRICAWCGMPFDAMKKVRGKSKPVRVEVHDYYFCVKCGHDVRPQAIQRGSE